MSSIASSVPGKTGVPTLRAIFLQLTLSPSNAIASGDGPMNSKPLSRQTSAKCAFSERKP